MIPFGHDIELSADAPPGVDDPAGAVRIVQRTLLRIPGRRRMTVGDIGCGAGDLLPFLAWHFRAVVALDPDAAALAAARERCEGLAVEYRRSELDDLGSLRGRLQLAVALDSLAVPGLERVLAGLRDTLAVGGLLLATLPAAPRSGGPRRARLAGDALATATGLCEFEAQFLLRRAGFPGLRMLRLPPTGAGSDGTLLVLASRRPSN